MKQGLLLIAIYALIINQVRKDDQQQDIPEDILQKIQGTVPVSPFNDQSRINKYVFPDQSVFLITSADKRSFIMLEDGTCYEVIDDNNEAYSRNPGYANAVFKSRYLAQK